MPELPEVETVLNFLNKNIRHRKIIAMTLFLPKTWKNIQPFDQAKTIFINHSIVAVIRRGKYLFFEINDNYLVFHLRMEGKFYYNQPQWKKSPSNLLIIKFADQTHLIFDDFRKFATIDYISKIKFNDYLHAKKIGLEPFDYQLTPEYLYRHWNHRKIKIKQALLEQKIIAGIGNIYASEILFAAKIHPEKLTNQLSQKDLIAIIKFTRKILTNAIALNGSTIKSFQINNRPGKYHTQLKVYQKQGQNCQFCNSKIKNIKIQNRSSFFCITCQKK